MKNLWNPSEAAKAKDKLDLLVYTSRLIGSEANLCVWGGGNTSTKMEIKDHCGRNRNVLFIKGSGSDLKISVRKDFPPVDLDDLLQAFKIDQMTDEEMVDYVSRCLLEPKAPRPSIEVLLHAFVDQPDIDHTHADAILSITNTQNGKKIAGEIFGDELLWVPYVKPGFTLAKWVGEAYRKNPKAKGVILEKHGLITWGPDAKTSYGLTIEMVTRAERYIARTAKAKKVGAVHESPLRTLSKSQRKEWLLENLPVIRKAVSRNQKVVLHVTDSPEVMDFINARDAATVSQIGPATPDHMLRTKRVPVFLDPKQDPEHQIQKYADDHKRYFEKYKYLLPPPISSSPGFVLDSALKKAPRSNNKNNYSSSEARHWFNGGRSREETQGKMLDPYPKVILVPGIGMITTGSDLRNAKIVAEIYEHSISVMKNASTIDTYESLSEKLAFEMDYWPMELYKLSLAPPEAEFSRQIGLVTGAARGIGRAIAARLAAEGAHVFLADINAEKVREACELINVGAIHELPLQSKKEKTDGRAFPLMMDVTNPESVQKAFEQVILQCGGIDFLVSNAGIAHVSPVDKLELKDWEKSFAVNATGHFLVSREAVNLFKRQGLGGAIVFIASKNVLAPGKDFGAYSASKAAQTQLARILAIENGECNIRVNMVNPDGVFEGSGLWDKIGPERAETYGLKPCELAGYYQKRNLMKTEVLPEDVAEAAAFLLSKKSSKTTGCILTVDGGVKEAFPR